MNDASLRQSVYVPVALGTTHGPGQFMTFHGLVDGLEHLAIGFGAWESQEVPLVRVHSECLTGDVFASGKCDCGEQLAEAVSRMQKEGGILIYLRQEGRGIGLYNKLDAYHLQSQGLDTFEANRRLGLGDDLRDYRAAAQMLRVLKKTEIQLLSNNPDKIRQLESMGIKISKAVATGVFVKASNHSYLKTKIDKSGHRIQLSTVEA